MSAQLWTPRPWQVPVLRDLERNVPNILVICHRRFGKTSLMLQDVRRRAALKQGNYFFMMPQTEQVRKTIWNDKVASGERRIFSELNTVLAGPPRENEMTVDLKVIKQTGEEKTYAYTGETSRLQFTGSDNHRSLRGSGGYGWYLDEWAYCDPQALATIRPIIVENKGYIRFLTTPCGKNHAYKMMEEFQGKPGWAVHYLPVSVTKAIDANALRDVQLEYMSLYGPEVGRALYEQEYECSFEEIVPGSFYLDLLLKAERERRIINMAPRPDLPVYAAFDLGFTDPTSIWFVQLKEDGWVDIIDYEEITRTSIPELIPVLRNKPWYYAELQLPHDGPHHEVTSGTTTEKILTTAGFRVRTMPRTDDGAQIPSVRQLLPRCRFANTASVQRGLDCLRHYHNKAKQEAGGRTSWSPRPVHDWSSHGAKAFATLAYFAPTLTSGVKAPPGKAAQPYQPSMSGVGGWMG